MKNYETEYVKNILYASNEKYYITLTNLVNAAKYLIEHDWSKHTVICMVADDLKLYIEEILQIYTFSFPNYFVNDMLRHFLLDVNWFELAREAIED